MSNKFYSLAAILVGVFGLSSSHAKLVHYELTATRGSTNLSGKKLVEFALLLNGSIPAPTLEFTEGDEAEIVVKNRIPEEELSIHWHGLLLPNEQDGVPYVTTPPIPSGTDYTFRFKTRQHGTYWYHSHTNVQEQKGLYGAFVIHAAHERIKADQELVVVLSDWSDEDGLNILKNLRKDGDYYLYKKGTVRSWWGAISSGRLGNFLTNEWTRMGGMDLSDVGYDAFLINGKRDLQLSSARPGQKIRLRIINAAASSYFHVALGDEPMQVIAADGIEMQPIEAGELLMGMAETYDVLFEVPEQRNYELRVSAQDGTGSASGWIGSGERVLAPVKAMPDQYATMNHSGDHSANHGAHDSESHAEHSDHSVHTDHTQAESVETLTVDELQAPQSTEFSKALKVHDIKLELGGDMRRYVWHINNKAIYQDRNIEINAGEVVRFTLVNNTMMHHPMHLHGHFFRVVNQFGPRSPLKHTVDVAPHSTRTIEFLADEPGEWMLHCHNLYHLKNGMARVVKYSTFRPTPEMAHFQHHDPHLHDHWYYYGMLEAGTNHGQIRLRASQTWNQFEARIETRNSAGRNFDFRSPWELEGDVFYRRWFNQYFNLMGGATYFDEKPSAVLGFGFILPFLVTSNVTVDQRGTFRIDLEKRFQWTSWLFTDADVTWRPGQGTGISTDAEFEISLMYGPAWSWAAGLMVTNQSVGAGAQFQF